MAAKERNDDKTSQFRNDHLWTGLEGNYLNGTNFRSFLFLEKNCISRVFIFAVGPFKDFFAGINFRGLLILCTFLNIAQISKIKEKKKRKSF